VAPERSENGNYKHGSVSSADSKADQRAAENLKARWLGACVAYPKWIDKLISAGYLRPSERHRAEAVRGALDRLRKRSKETMEEEWR
jgi:hypothetical protein